MTGIVWRPIGDVGNALVVLDATRRTYAALSREGDRYHLISPARLDDPRVGDGKRHAGQLVCTCAGGTIRGTCYRTAEAEAFEAGQRANFTAAAADPQWFDAAPGELIEAFGK